MSDPVRTRRSSSYACKTYTTYLFLLERKTHQVTIRHYTADRICRRELQAKRHGHTTQPAVDTVDKSRQNKFTTQSKSKRNNRRSKAFPSRLGPTLDDVAKRHFTTAPPSVPTTAEVMWRPSRKNDSVVHPALSRRAKNRTACCRTALATAQTDVYRETGEAWEYCYRFRCISAHTCLRCTPTKKRSLLPCFAKRGLPAVCRLLVFRPLPMRKKNLFAEPHVSMPLPLTPKRSAAYELFIGRFTRERLLEQQ